MSFVKVEFSLPLNIAKKEGYYLASCEQFDIHAEGDTYDDAREHLKDALVGFIEVCLETGTLDKVMLDSGFKHVLDHTPEVPRGDFINVPIPLLFGNHNGIQNARSC